MDWVAVSLYSSYYKLKRIIFYIIGRTKPIFQHFPNIRFTKQHFARKLNKRENAIIPIIL